MSENLKKTIRAGTLLVPFLIHFALMTVLLILSLLNIKYGLEEQLIGSEHVGIIDDFYVIIYWLYWGSIISSAVLFYLYFLIFSWLRKKKERAESSSQQ
jgi:prepilin signal peptidase PulO-like enzyme (type II secretory pathway)